MTSIGALLAAAQQNKVDVKPSRPMVEAPHQAITEWNISERTCVLYDYRSTSSNHYAGFKNADGLTTAQHVRRLDPKGFSWNGERTKPMQLFGQNLGTQGWLIICEGEKDCLCVRELLTSREKTKFVVVSIPDGVTSAVQSIKPHLSWVLGFDRVIILFDSDRARESRVLNRWPSWLALRPGLSPDWAATRMRPRRGWLAIRRR